MLFSRNLLYTAVTRAQQALVIIGEREVVTRMIANNRPTRRNTTLRIRLCEAFGRPAAMIGWQQEIPETDWTDELIEADNVEYDF